MNPKVAFLVGCLALMFCVPQPSSAAEVKKTDIVFMIDATGSMAGEIAGVRSGFSAFVSDLTAQNVDARYAVVVFGGQPELTLDFTADGSVVQTALNSIIVNGANSTQNNHNVNPEAGLETIRMVLGAAAVNEFANNHIPQDGLLDFRSDARKNLILVTDEDSDWAFHALNRFPNQLHAGDGSPSPWTQGWQDEVDATATAVIANQAFLNLLINPGDFPARRQYGDWAKDVSDANLLNFDSAGTLANLLADSETDDSLQAQVLASGLIARSFNVAGANDATFVSNFFSAKVEEILTDTGPDPVPEPATIVIWSLLGMCFAGAYRLRRRNGWSKSTTKAIHEVIDRG